MRTRTHRWIGEESKFTESGMSVGNRTDSFDYISSALFNWPDFLSDKVVINKRLAVGMRRNEWVGAKNFKISK